MDLKDLPQEVLFPLVATPDVVVARYIEEYSKRGDVVLDPFAGYGSTIKIAQRMGRQAYGIEIDAERYDYASRNIPVGAQLFHGDARELHLYDIPPIDLCFTGPPFFASERLFNLEGFPSLAQDYETYLQDFGAIFAAIAKLLRPAAYVIAILSNLRVPAGFRGEGTPAGILPLSWDSSRMIDRSIPLVREEIWCQEGETESYPRPNGHAQIQIFQKV